jgi:hypothetical protein
MTQLEQLQRLLDSLVAAGAPGAAAWVQDEDGSLQAAGGVADISTGRPMEARLRFRAGSLTKSLVATVVLQLVAEGRLSLADTLEHWLPKILPYGDQVTIRQLLGHTSGVPQDWATIERTLYGSRQGRFRSWSPQALVALVAGRPPSFPPGRTPTLATSCSACWWRRPAARRSRRSCSGASSSRSGCAAPTSPATLARSRGRCRAATAFRRSKRGGAGRSAAGLHGPESLLDLGGGRAGVRPRGPRRLPPGVAGRPAAAARAAGRDAVHRPGPAWLDPAPPVRPLWARAAGDGDARWPSGRPRRWDPRLSQHGP